MSIQGKTILFIDDDPDLRALVKRVLENVGMVCTAVESVAAGLEAMREALPHLVLCDLQMPGVSGFSFLDERRGDFTWQSVPVVVVSALRDRDTVYRAIGLGASDYLLKPFTAAVLIQRVRKALKDKEFLSFEYGSSDRPKATGAVAAEAKKVTEAGFLLESAIKFSGQSQLHFRCDAFDKIGMDRCVYQTRAADGVRGVSGFYFSQVQVMGLDAPIPQKLKKGLK